METTKEIFSGKQLRVLIIPLILEQILGITVGFADSVMVSSAGEAAVSGVSLVDTINILLVNIFCSLATGGAVAAAHRLGEKHHAKAIKTADQLLYCITGISLLVMAVSLAGNRLILGTVFGNVEKAVMDNAVIYFYITALSFPFLGIYNASSALSRAMGNSRITMYISVLMNVVNIIGNAVFIMVFHAGVYGVATSTLISRILGAVLMYIILLDQKKPLHFSRTLRIRFRPEIIKNIMKVGIPTGLDNCIFQIGKILVQSLIAGLGTTAITANAIAGVVAGVAVIPASAVGTAMITVVGQSAGAGEAGQAVRYVKKLMTYAYGGMIVLNILIILLADKIVGLYLITPESAAMAREVVILHSVCAMLFWPTGFALPNAMRATFDAGFTMVVSIASMWIFRIGLSYFLVRYLEVGLTGVWAAMGVDWVFRSVCFVWRMKSGRWLKHLEVRKKMPEAM